MPGPVGKRSDAKHGHRSKEELRVDKAAAGSEVVWHPADTKWNPIAARFYAGLQVSGQVQFYEQSDADTAYYVAEAMSRNLTDGKFSAMLFASVMSSMGDLLVTEGSRRRAKVELQRELEAPDTEVDDAIRDLLSDPQFSAAAPVPPQGSTDGGSPES